MFRNVLANIPLAEDVDIEKLAKLTEGYGGADICASGGVCYKAKVYAVRRWLARRRSGNGAGESDHNRVENVTMADFERAIGEVVPAIKYAAGVIEQIEEWRRMKVNKLNDSKED